MKQIGLISDTHGYLDNAIFKHFDNCDEIWHSGDFGSLDVVNKLSRFKPLTGVHGNIDDKEIRNIYPLEQSFVCEDVSVFMTHIGGYPGHYKQGIKSILKRNKIKLFISGHSHILKVCYDKELELLHMNPGAFGKEGFHKVRTLLRFRISGTKIYDLEIIESKR